MSSPYETDDGRKALGKVGPQWWVDSTLDELPRFGPVFARKELFGWLIEEHPDLRLSRQTDPDDPDFVCWRLFHDARQYRGNREIMSAKDLDTLYIYSVLVTEEEPDHAEQSEDHGQDDTPADKPDGPDTPAGQQVRTEAPPSAADGARRSGG